MIVNIPFFPGFYESMLSEQLNYEEWQWCEYEAENIKLGREYLSEHELGVELLEIRKIIPDYKLTAEDFAEACMDSTNYGDCYREASKMWVKNLNHHFELDATWESMTSPREYNFSTDRVFAEIALRKLEEMRAALAGQPDMAEVIKWRFTSRSGFISHYPNKLAEWTKPLEDWDHNELGTLLEAFLRMKCRQANIEFESNVDQLDTGNGELMQCLEAGRDYEKLWSLLRDKIESDMPE